MDSAIKHPSAILPIGMSFATLLIIAVHIALHGTAPQADEGTAAHLFQILMAGQVPVMMYFALTWFPRAPRQALWVLALQVGAALLPMSVVFYLHW